MTSPFQGQPGGQPAPTGWGQPPQQGYVQQAPPQQGQPQAGWAQPPMPPAVVDPNMRIAQGDRRFPAELWGKTLGESMQYYSVMKQDFMQRNNPAQQPQQPQQPRGWGQPQQQPQAAPPPTYSGHVPVFDPSGGQQPQPFGPDQVRQIMREEFGRLQAPMMQNTMESVRNGVAAGLPDWNQYSADIHMALQGATPEMLMNPESWKMAYYAVKGKALTERPQQAAPQAPVDPFRQNGGGTPNGNPAAVQRPAAPQQPQQWGQPAQPFPGGQSFTEAPINQSAYNPAVQADDPRDVIMAQRFGIPVEEYRQWKGGNVPPAPQPQVPGYPQPGYPQQPGMQPAHAGIPQRW